MRKRDLIEEAKCHLTTAIIGAVVAAGSAYASAASAAANRKNARNAAAMGGGAGGGGGANFQPTALAQMAKPKDTSGMGLADLLGKQQKEQQGAQFGETPNPFGDKQDAFTADAKPRPAGSQDSDFHVAQPAQQTSVQDEQAKQFGTKDYINSASQVAGLVSQLAQRPQTPGAPIPQPGQMNFQPTALAMLARRNPYGGF